MVNMALGLGHAAGWASGLLVIGYIVRLAALEIIVLCARDVNRRNRALMLRFPRLARLGNEPPRNSRKR
jgi:hypothetical protein